MLRQTRTRSVRPVRRYIISRVFKGKMAYVPGCANDLFISYSHGDDRVWIRNFYVLLKAALKEQLGIAPEVWIDHGTLQSSADHRSEIPDSLRSSALFLLLPSNQYVRSSYCVDVECREFEAALPDHVVVREHHAEWVKTVSVG